MGIRNCFVVWITYIRILISPFTIDSWKFQGDKKEAPQQQQHQHHCNCHQCYQHYLYCHHHQQQDPMNKRNKADENPTKQSRNKRYFSANIKFIDVYFMLYASQIPRIRDLFHTLSLSCRSFIRWYVSAASAIADTVIVVTVVVFYLSFDCYRKRHSFDRFVYVGATLSRSLCLWVCGFVQMSFRYILSIISSITFCGWFVRMRISCCNLIPHHSCSISSLSVSHWWMRSIQAQVGLVNLPNTTTAGIGNTHWMRRKLQQQRFDFGTIKKCVRLWFSLSFFALLRNTRSAIPSLLAFTLFRSFSLSFSILFFFIQMKWHMKFTPSSLLHHSRHRYAKSNRWEK